IHRYIFLKRGCIFLKNNIHCIITTEKKYNCYIRGGRQWNIQSQRLLVLNADSRLMKKVSSLNVNIAYLKKRNNYVAVQLRFIITSIKVIRIINRQINFLKN